MYILGWGLQLFPDHPRSFFASQFDTAKGGYNTPGFNNVEFDNLITQFEAAATVEEAIVIHKQLEAILFEEMPYCVLFNNNVTEALDASKLAIPKNLNVIIDGITNSIGNEIIELVKYRK